MFKSDLQKYKSSVLFWCGLVLFFGLNLFSAISTGIHFDEAYYWLYSKKLAFGYFDHPPMIAWLIYAGQLLFSHHAVGLRFFIVILSSASVYILWLLSKQYGERPLLFWALIYSVILIHPYSFIATPDAPLFFFTTLFFLIYNKYAERDSIGNTILLALVSALLLYSKYHAVLVIGFTFLSNTKQLRKKTFWIYLLLLSICMVPQLMWQIDHHFASFRYHLVDSHKTIYHPEVTIEYLLNQLLLTGPWLGWLFLFILFTGKPVNLWEKALKWTGVGTFVFFFVVTFSGDCEAHWTLVAFVPLIIWAYKYLSKHQKWQKWVYMGSGVNFVLLLAVRIVVTTPMVEKIHALKFLKGWDEDTAMLKQAAGGYPVIFQDTWNRAARYAWYANDPAITNLNSGMYRKNQFDIWNRDEKYTHQTVCIVSIDSTQFVHPKKVVTHKATWYLQQIPNFKSYYDLSFQIKNKAITGNRLLLSVQIDNVYDEKINLGKDGAKGRFQLYKKEGSKWLLLHEYPLQVFTLNANSTGETNIRFDLNGNDPDMLYLMLRIGKLKPIPAKQIVCRTHSD